MQCTRIHPGIFNWSNTLKHEDDVLRAVNSAANLLSHMKLCNACNSNILKEMFSTLKMEGVLSYAAMVPVYPKHSVITLEEKSVRN
jgi:hypothetical protein